ncbi:MAG TPA: DUF177 domain-containing protein [Thiobacillaceae bacterium]|nr:DUF177 domain-containing protein [Thiobacillaceae bacterium]HNU63568.1 DUF177 domain-containing protein [Thiobacillaceae bacterium]
MQFARAGGHLAGEYRAEECGRLLPRLTEVLPRAGAGLRYRLSGCVQAGRPALRLEVSVILHLTCQRCLEVYDETMTLDRFYPIARDEAELARWERDEPLLDALVADPRLEVAELLEDEILLSVPMVPRHPEGGCGRDGRTQVP